MGPGFHRLYAARLAWRYRLLLALALVLLGVFHPLLALLSPLGLLLPARLWEGRALKEISRVSLAYATALAYGEERLWAEAGKVPARLPPFPWGLLLAYGLALLLVLGLHLARPALLPFPSPAGVERVGPPSQEGQAQDEVARGKKAQGSAGGEAQGQGVRTPGKEGEETGEGIPSGASPTQAPGKEEASSQDLSQSGKPGDRAGPTERGHGTEGEASSQDQKRSGVGGALEEGEGTLPPTQAQGPEVGLLGEGEEGEEAALPSPWPAGRPPEAVRRGVEVYLEKTPLSPEARELLRRYFAP